MELCSLSRVEEVVERELTPYVGKTMAQAATRGHVRSLGLAERELEAEKVEALIAKVVLGLHIFVGREKASELEGSIRRQLMPASSPAGPASRREVVA